MDKIGIYLEVGTKKTFAGALDWPGWCRGGRDEEQALTALLEAGPRYQRVLAFGSIPFQPPSDMREFEVRERLEGSATTDFGAPDIAPAFDSHSVDETELRRLVSLLNSCWQAYDAACQAAAGRELAKGPRGGGRDLENITRHVMGAEGGYLGRVLWKKPKVDDMALDQALALTRQAVVEALESAALNGLPARGPRGGALWTPRYFTRRVAWHVLDHAWEIEDRIT